MREEGRRLWCIRIGLDSSGISLLMQHARPFGGKSRAGSVSPSTADAMQVSNETHCAKMLTPSGSGAVCTTGRLNRLLLVGSVSMSSGTMLSAAPPFRQRQIGSNERREIEEERFVQT